MSRGFIAVLTGIVLTVFGRIGPWRWPVWPAATILDLYLEKAAPSVVSGNVKALGLVALMLINVGFWALIVRGLFYLAGKMAKPQP